ncbi:MAG: hypothetical protein KF910_01450 [Brevundimonas sp.]|uniref:hypothetical protein n=1 Tax=Brevundimonas sp. TaxID=1871086 RepID=UPI0025BF3E33|nr:hypothetical protein [Brevundimonas sp.]MBX3476248.1 hypothetical protein [Brevundimonas sp.]
MLGLRTKTLMAVAASALTLAACGSAEVASPGEGDFGNGGNTGGNNGGGNNPAPGTPAADCPTGFANVGVVANGTLRACQLPQQIIGALTVPLRAGTIYSISGRTEVGTDRGADPNAPTPGSQQGILTIEAGVRLFASGGSDYLLVNRGSQIFAEGTSTNPIVFTSRQNVEGTTTTSSMGQWGGIVLAGRAPTAVCPVGVTAPNAACVGQVEGTSANYGGNTLADNSGRLRYVQIKYSGFELSPNNELQALTLAGVGTGTTIEYVQAYNSSDDGIEIFGGTVNLRYIVINGADDDGLDTDTGWKGGAQFGIITQRPTPGTGGSRGFEWSAAPSGTAYYAEPKVSNWTVVGRNAAVAADAIITLNTGTKPTIINSIFVNPTTSAAACLDIDDAQTVANAPVFRSVFFACSRPYENDSNVNAAATEAVFTAAGNVNNTAAGTHTMTAPAGATMQDTVLTFINGANETAVTPTDAAAIHPFFQNVTYIGAVRNAADTWYLGWTCGLQAGSNC